jgi:hypothetical protein
MYQDIMLELDTRDQYEDALEFARYFAKRLNLEVHHFKRPIRGDLQREFDTENI